MSMAGKKLAGRVEMLNLFCALPCDPLLLETSEQNVFLTLMHCAVDFLRRNREEC